MPGMSDLQRSERGGEADWLGNYFNYFTEVEECFQRARGTGLFLLSPLDWALIESWRTTGIPLEAVLKGVNAAFEKWRSRKTKRRLVNSLAYCAQAVMEVAQRTPAQRSVQPGEAPFAAEEISRYLQTCAAQLRDKGESALQEIAASLDTLTAEVANCMDNLGELEQRLTALEEKMVAVLRASQTDKDLFAIRHALDTELRPYRSKMTADQLALLERRYIDTALLERAALPRLSLFYLR
jgi:polyhydroxyalkanoate synthesis regulator phasin